MYDCKVPSLTAQNLLRRRLTRAQHWDAGPDEHLLQLSLPDTIDETSRQLLRTGGDNGCAPMTSRAWLWRKRCASRAKSQLIKAHNCVRYAPTINRLSPLTGRVPITQEGDGRKLCCVCNLLPPAAGYGNRQQPAGYDLWVLPSRSLQVKAWERYMVWEKTENRALKH